MKTKSVVILVVILLIAAILGFYKFNKEYQKEQENIPTLYAYDINGSKIELLPVEYTWEYKGNKKEFKMADEAIDENFKNMQPVYLDIKNNNFAYAQTKEKYKISAISSTTEYAEDSMTSSGTTYQYSDTKFNILNASEPTVGKTEFYINFAKQGSVRYVAKTFGIDFSTCKELKEYMNTSITDENRIKEMVSKMDLKEILDSVKVDGNNLILEYEFYPYSKKVVGYNNTILFTYIDGLENIIYTAKNKKVRENKIIDNKYTPNDYERENLTISKNDIGLDINQIREYIKREV